MMYNRNFNIFSELLITFNGFVVRTTDDACVIELDTRDSLRVTLEGSNVALTSQPVAVKSISLGEKL